MDVDLPIKSKSSLYELKYKIHNKLYLHAMTRLSHTHGKKIQYFMYIFKDLHFHIQFIKFKKVLCTKSRVQSL